MGSPAWTLVVVALAAWPTASAVPSLNRGVGEVPTPIMPAHHDADGVPERDYNWDAFYDENPTTEPPILIDGVVRPANDPLIVEGHVWNHRGANCCPLAAIEVRNSQNVIVRNNEFYWHGDAIRVTDSSGITIETNYFQDGFANPASIFDSSGVVFRRNVLQSIEIWYTAPVHWGIITADGGVWLDGASSVIIESNRFQQSSQTGVSSSAFRGARNADIVVRNNVFEDQRIALSIVSTDGLAVSNNLFQGFTQKGVSVGRSTGVSADNNTFLAVHSTQRSVGAHPAQIGWSAFFFDEETAAKLRHNDMGLHMWGYVVLAMSPIQDADGYAVWKDGPLVTIPGTGTSTIDAKHNWWGGPGPPGVPPSGAIRGDVTFIPWSLQPNHPIPSPPRVTYFDDEHEPPCPETMDSRLEIVLGVACPVWPFTP